MKLDAYLKREKITASEFAARMGKPASTVTRLLNGERSATMDLLEAVRVASHGAVMPNDFLPSQIKKARAVA